MVADAPRMLQGQGNNSQPGDQYFVLNQHIDLDMINVNVQQDCMLKSNFTTTLLPFKAITLMRDVTQPYSSPSATSERIQLALYRLGSEWCALVHACTQVHNIRRLMCISLYARQCIAANSHMQINSMTNSKPFSLQQLTAQVI